MRAIEYLVIASLRMMSLVLFYAWIFIGTALGL